MRNIAAVVVSLILVTACSEGAEPGSAAFWVKQLESKKPDDRISALKELGKLGDASTLPDVIRMLDEDGPWQPVAAYTLGQLGDPSVAQKLVAKLDFAVGTGRDKRTKLKNRINLNASRALGMLKAKAAVSPLIKLLKTQNLSTREQVMRALGKIGDETAAEALVKIAVDETHPFLRKVAIQSLGDLGSPKAVPALVRNLYFELPGVSFYNEARFSLLQVGSESVPELVKTLQRKNKDVEGITLPSGGGLAEGAIEAKASSVLGYLAAKQTEADVVKALNRLTQLYSKRESQPVYASVPGAIIEMAYALGNMNASGSVSVLESITKDVDARTRKAATEALAMIGSKKSVPVLIAAAKTGDKAAKSAAVVAATRLGDESTIAALNGLGDAETKEVVASNLPRLEAAKVCKADKACWADKLNDTDEKVRERAAYELGWLGAKTSIEGLIGAAEDKDSGVRMAAIASIAKLGGANTETLSKIAETWSGKIEFAESTQELKRLIARLESEKRG
jgi:HEAT repeat protein